ncbi:MAG: NAD(+) diphosphatase [Alphaproteobacteria bacterium]
MEKFTPFSPLPMGNTKLNRDPELRRKYKNIHSLMADYPPIIILCLDDAIAPLAQDMPLDENRLYFLGLLNDKAYIAYDAQNDLIDADWQHPRDIAAKQKVEEIGQVATAFGLARWHRHHQFCPKCGQASQPILLGEARQCTDNACQNITYPRIDPSMITLLTHQFEDGEKALLIEMHGRNGMHTTISGFMSVGETLEETVIREIKEETNVIASDVRFIASQPWPFPQSLMLGCRAVALTTDIAIEKEELVSANWFSKEEVIGLRGENKLPPLESIARHLIEQWLAT